MRRWSQEAEEALQCCFEAADWIVLCQPHGEDINVCVRLIIYFCVDNTIPTRTVRCFPSGKPWVTSDLKELLKPIKERGIHGGIKGVYW